MNDLYMIGFIALAGLLFVIGLVMIIRGVRRYDFHPLVLLVPFLATATFSFPVYFVLKERYLKKSGASDEAIARTHRQTVLGFAFVIAFIAVTCVTTVGFFVQSFDTFQATGAETLDLDGTVWGRGMFLGALAVSALYAAASLRLNSRKRNVWSV